MLSRRYLKALQAKLGLHASCQGLRVGVSSNVLEWPAGLEGCRSGQRRGAISTTVFTISLN